MALRIFLIFTLSLITSPLFAQGIQQEIVLQIAKRLAQTGEAAETRGAMRWVDRVKPAIQDAWTLEAESTFRQAEPSVQKEILDSLKNTWFVRQRGPKIYQVIADCDARASVELSRISTADIVKTFQTQEDMLRFIDQNPWLKNQLNTDELLALRSIHPSAVSQAPLDANELGKFIQELREHPLRGRLLTPETLRLANGTPNAEEMAVVARNLTDRSRVNWAYDEFVSNLTLTYKWSHLWTHWKNMPRLVQTRILKLFQKHEALIKLANAPKRNEDIVNTMTELNKIADGVARGGEPGRFSLPWNYMQRMINHEALLVQTEIETMEVLAEVSENLSQAVSTKMATDSFYKSIQDMIGPCGSIEDMRAGLTRLGYGNFELGIKTVLEHTHGSYNPLSLRSIFLRKWLIRKVIFVITGIAGYYANAEPTYEIPPFGEEEDNPPLGPKPELGGEPPQTIPPTDLWKESVRLQMQEIVVSLEQLEKDKIDLMEQLKTVTDAIQKRDIHENLKNKIELILQKQERLEDLKKKFNLSQSIFNDDTDQ